MLMSLISLTNFTWDPRSAPLAEEHHLSSAPCTFLSSVRAVPAPPALSLLLVLWVHSRLVLQFLVTASSPG